MQQKGRIFVSVTVINEPKHVVAIIGGAIAGSTAAEVLSDAGVVCVVFEQNDRPYGKIEDGLPRWHEKQRRMEYGRIDARLDKPNVFFVPRTRLGPDVDFGDLVKTWQFSAVVLANGAWRDRQLPVEGVDQYIGKGLIYQNSFIYWFNHKNEKLYSGPRYEVSGGSIVVGGGLASVDVVKVIQLELYEQALKARGVKTSMLELEHKGIPAICAANNVNPDDLGVQDVVLYYRRRDIDMPLAQTPDNPTPEQVQKTQQVRQKILFKLMEKFRVRFQPNHAPIGAVVENDRLVGLRFVKTDGGSAKPIPGTEVDVRAPLIVSSVGSIPEPLPGVEMKGEYYIFKDSDTGAYAPVEGVFGLGNVVTGKGNIEVSRKHAASVSKKILENYLGLGNGDRDISFVHEAAEDRTRRQLEDVQNFLRGKTPLAVPQVNAIMSRVHERLQQVGYTSYRQFLNAVTPPDLE
jgi:NADPH-dependent glutamate synthase beta subunit-like oxidoreductase